MVSRERESRLARLDDQMTVLMPSFDDIGQPIDIFHRHGDAGRYAIQ